MVRYYLLAKSVSSNFHTNRLTFQNYVDKFQTLCLGLLWYTWPNINIVHSNSCFNTQLTMFRTSPFSTHAREKASETSAKPAGAKQAKRPHPYPLPCQVSRLAQASSSLAILSDIRYEKTELLIVYTQLWFHGLMRQGAMRISCH